MIKARKYSERKTLKENNLIIERLWILKQKHFKAKK